MLDVLILTAGYGEGHNAAARGLLSACANLGFTAEIGDAFAALGATYDRSRKQYLDLIERAPGVWAMVYAWADHLPLVEFTLPLIAPVREALTAMLEEKKPVAVISVYPVYGYLIAQIFPVARPFALHTVITDSITINRVWHRCPSDSFIVPNAASAAVLDGYGVPAGQVRDLGFPVPLRFADERPLRPAPGGGERGRVLYMINAGRQSAPAVVARLLEIEGIHLTVTVGRDEALRERVLDAAAGRPLDVHGWTPNMPELLMTHHVLIGKAGGATVQEAIAAETPLLITQIVPGQEEGNARLVFENECAAFCPTPHALAEEVERLFAGEAAEWRRWHANIRRLSRPDAARDIVRFVTQSAKQEREHSSAALRARPRF